MKVKWTKTVPEGEGWFWIKYKGKHGMMECPCYIMRFKTDLQFIIQTARNDYFCSHTPQDLKKYKVSFGPSIETPD